MLFTLSSYAPIVIHYCILSAQLPTGCMMRSLETDVIDIHELHSPASSLPVSQ